jgi:UDP-N-acetylglucosamine 2-epimerase (non-hydrolysing)
MKIAPIYRESLKYRKVDCTVVHTGQHYDYEMSQGFFEDLKIPKPDFFLNAGSGSHAIQTGKIMVVFEKLCQEEKPDLVIVVGDVNSTLACSIVAKKLLIDVAHVEAGLRSFDMTMPEEINRMVTDSISDYFFVTEESGIVNLLREGRREERIHLVGNVMIDNLFYQLRQLDKENGRRFSVYDLKKRNSDYIFLTLHRPSNVDFQENFEAIASALNEIAQEKPIFFTVHPRSKKMMERFDIKLNKNIIILPPLSFMEALFLWKDALLVMTDSGGLQEETTAMGVPCVTLRYNTERPVTIDMGTNVLAGNKKESIIAAYSASLEKKGKEFSVPPKWDGRASKRIWNILLSS